MAGGRAFAREATRADLPQVHRHVYERKNDGWHEDEFIGWFHTWGSTFEEFDNGAVPVTTGIVEDEHGKVWNTAAENIRFID